MRPPEESRGSSDSGEAMELGEVEEQVEPRVGAGESFGYEVDNVLFI